MHSMGTFSRLYTCWKRTLIYISVLSLGAGGQVRKIYSFHLRCADHIFVQLDSNVTSNANSALYCTFAFFGFIAGTGLNYCITSTLEVFLIN